MTKVEEKLKAGRVKRPEGCGFSDEPQRRPMSVQSSKKEPATASSGENVDNVFIDVRCLDKSIYKSIDKHGTRYIYVNTIS